MELLENPQPTRQRNRKSGSDNCPLSSILVIMPLFRELTISLMQFQKSSLLMIVENSDSLILLNFVALIFSELFLAKNSSEKISATKFSKIRESLFSTIINNDDFWNCIKEIVNSRNKGIITKIEESGQLSEPDLRFLCLVGCGFSNNSIAILSSYTNVHSISNRKRIIADKLQLPSSLDDLFAVSSSDEA